MNSYQKGLSCTQIKMVNISKPENYKLDLISMPMILLIVIFLQVDKQKKYIIIVRTSCYVVKLKCLLSTLALIVYVGQWMCV